jgi:hypothetical protein
VTFPNAPCTVETPRCLTAKAADECGVSSFHSPAKTNADIASVNAPARNTFVINPRKMEILTASLWHPVRIPICQLTLVRMSDALLVDEVAAKGLCKGLLIYFRLLMTRK